MKTLLKSVLIISLIFVFVVPSFSQDIIYKKDGTEIKCKVEEVDEVILKVIVYRAYDNLNGPTRKILISNVFLIKYENGIVENFKQKTLEEKEQPVEKPLKVQPLIQPIKYEESLKSPPIESLDLSVKNQTSSRKNYFLLNFGGSLLIPFGESLSEVVGSMFLFGGGIGVDLGNASILSRFQTGNSNYEDDWKINHTQLDILANFNWYSSKGPVQVYSGIGFSYIVLTDKGPSSKETGNGFGVLLDLGLDITLGKSTILFFSSTSTFGSVTIYGGKVSVSSEKLNFGLKFKL